MPNSWESLLQSWEPRLRQAFDDAVRNMRDAAHIDTIARMLENGDIDGALRAVGLDPIQFRPFDKALEAAYESGGNATAKLVPTTVEATGLRVVFQFNIRNLIAEQWLKNYSSTLVTEILDDQRTMVREFLKDGLARGLNPRTTALDLVGRQVNGIRQSGTIGLTSSQAEWVRNYEAELRSDNPLNALQRLLRDKRFDKTVMKAAKAGEAIPEKSIQSMVTSYKNRALRYRAEAIARTETITALHAAQEESINQAIRSGAITQSQVKYIWRTAHDKRVRDTHQTMDGQIRPMGQEFITGSGAHLRYPGDPTGPAAEVINCRCFREPKIDFLAGVR